MKTENLSYKEAMNAIFDGHVIRDKDGDLYKWDSYKQEVLMYNSGPPRFTGWEMGVFIPRCAPFEIISPFKPEPKKSLTFDEAIQTKNINVYVPEEATPRMITKGSYWCDCELAFLSVADQRGWRIEEVSG